MAENNKLHADDKEVLLAEIFEDLNICKVYIDKVLQEIEVNDVSNYPIIVLSKSDLTLGLKIIDKKEIDIKWNFNISHLEEFVIKGLVQEEKAVEFTRVYKEHKIHYCLFITISETEADFAYVKKNQI
ncbi:MAG: hypothetical protein ACI8ZX_000351 [Planctomycetota bacterium]|jgi:hypothetical protein